MRVRVRRFGRLRSRVPRARARVSVRRRQGFPAPSCAPGFTRSPKRQLQLPGLLGPSPTGTHGRLALPSVWPFSRLQRDTTASADFSLRSRRRPFRRKARSPQARPSAFSARPPDLRCLPSVAGASRSSARSPQKAPPPIRFLFVGPLLSLHASSRHPFAGMPWRFAQVAATSSLRDLHPVAIAHAGAQKRGEGCCPPPEKGPSQRGARKLVDYTRPWSIMEFATFMKPAMLAPRT